MTHHKRKLRLYLERIVQETVDNYAVDSHLAGDMAELAVAKELESICVDMRHNAAHRRFKFWRKLHA